jgi:DNA modification methylase
MAKTLDDVRKSREAREQVRQQLGCIPESILVHDKSDRAMDLLVEKQERDYTSTFHQPETTATEFGKKSDDEREKHLFYLSGAGARWGALSRFPQNVGRVLLKLYSRDPYCAECREPLQKCKHDPETRTVRHDTVVDPFAGHNSRMELCYRSRRNYIGCDISKVFMDANFKLSEILLANVRDDMYPDDNTSTIELHNIDSRKMNHCGANVAPAIAKVCGTPDATCKHPIKNNTGDFTITSPPYWCLEDYGDEAGQLGKNEYQEFLRQLGVIAKQNFRCLKAGSFCVWCINDFRWEGKFYPYHMHTAQLLRDAGFQWHDIAITDLGGSFGQAFASQIVSNKILPKRHEYALIFRKP